MVSNTSYHHYQHLFRTVWGGAGGLKEDEVLGSGAEGFHSSCACSRRLPPPAAQSPRGNLCKHGGGD